MSKITTILLACSTTLLFTACGGGGGDTAPVNTEPTPNINQYDLRTFIDTSSFTLEGEGTINLSSEIFNMTGTYKSLYQGTDEPIPGAIVHLHDITMIINVEGTTVVQSAKSGTYMGYLVQIENETDGSWCSTPLRPDEITPVPTDAKVGYISDVIPLVCEDGTYKTIVMKLNDAGGGNAELSLITNVYASQGGALQSTETNHIGVTPDMSMVNVELSGSIPSEGATYTLSSTSILQN